MNHDNKSVPVTSLLDTAGHLIAKVRSLVGGTETGGAMTNVTASNNHDSGDAYMMITLPGNQQVVTLPKYLARALSHVIASGAAGISSLELQRLDVMNVHNVISELKKRGADIKTDLRDTVDRYGDLRKGIAHYSYEGWEIFYA